MSIALLHGNGGSLLILGPRGCARRYILDIFVDKATSQKCRDRAIARSTVEGKSRSLWLGDFGGGLMLDGARAPGLLPFLRRSNPAEVVSTLPLAPLTGHHGTLRQSRLRRKAGPGMRPRRKWLLMGIEQSGEKQNRHESFLRH